MILILFQKIKPPSIFAVPTAINNRWAIKAPTNLRRMNLWRTVRSKKWKQLAPKHSLCQKTGDNLFPIATKACSTGNITCNFVTKISGKSQFISTRNLECQRIQQIEIVVYIIWVIDLRRQYFVQINMIRIL